MTILLDACVPCPLRNLLSPHAVRTAQEMGWGRLKNGALLKVVEAEFDAFVTTDKNLRYQQSVPRQKLAILVLPTNDWPMLQRNGGIIIARIAALKPGDFLEMDEGEFE